MRNYSPWILGARPKTLTASFVPVFVGSALAYHQGKFNLYAFFACLIGALGIQIATNYINDAADFTRGADTVERIGPTRLAQSGLASVKHIYFAAAIAFFIAILAGIYLIYLGGLPILLIGIFSILAAIAYTAGPFPLAYYGLGDLFVFLFFGIIAVSGTYYVQTLQLNFLTLLAAIFVGCHAVAIIIVNNTRDIATDIKAGKKTFSVRIGPRASKIYYSAIIIVPYLGLLALVLLKNFSPWLLLPALSFPVLMHNLRKIFSAQTGMDFNQLLATTAKMQLMYGTLFSLGIML